MEELKKLLEKLKEAEAVHMADCDKLPHGSIEHWQTSGKVDAFQQVIVAVQQTLLDSIGKKPKCGKHVGPITRALHRNLGECNECENCGEFFPLA